LQTKVSKDLVSVLARIPDDEHVPVHAYMTAVAIKMLCWTHFGDYFKDDASVRKLHNSVVEVVMLILGIIKKFSLISIFR